MKHYSLWLLISVCMACEGQQTHSAPGADSSTIALENRVETDAPAALQFSVSTDSLSEKYPASVLNVSTYHDEEVEDDIGQRHWFGLFKKADSYYLSRCKLKVKRVEDLVEVPEGALAWDISTDKRDTSLLLISGLDYLTPAKLAHVDIKQPQLMPGDSLPFMFSGVRYTLYATGKRVGKEGDYSAEKYRLYLKAVSTGRTTTQLVISVERFDEALTTLLFIGDIDGDAKIDLIIDATDHYNAFVPALFLSKPADQGQLIKCVGLRVSVGC